MFYKYSRTCRLSYQKLQFKVLGIYYKYISITNSAAVFSVHFSMRRVVDTLNLTGIMPFCESFI